MHWFLALLTRRTTNTCGIAGVFAYSDAAPPVDREELLRVREQSLFLVRDLFGIKPLYYADDS